MSSLNTKRPFEVYILIMLLLFQVLSAFGGGVTMAAKPDGSALGIPLSMLDGSPFHNFLIPGIILSVVLGVLPLIAAIGLMFSGKWYWMGICNIYSHRHWAWTYALYTGLGLIIWITVQHMYIGYSILQTIYQSLGIAIVVFALMPRVMKYYEVTNE